MEEALLRIAQVIGRTGMNRTGIYRGIKAGTFPRPVKLGPRASAWRRSEIDAWIADRIAAARQAKAA